MAKNIEINITKQVQVQNSPFKIVIYVLKDDNNILIEDVNSGKSVLTSSYNVKDYIKLSNQGVPWTRMFNHQYIKIEDKHVSQFMPLYFEKNKFAILTFRIDKEMAPKFKIKEMEHPQHNPRGEHHTRLVSVIDNSLADPDETNETATTKTYDYFYGNIKDFEVENFKLEMIAAKTSRQMYDENFEYLKIPHITCRLPMFQLYSILKPVFNTSWTNKPIYNYKNESVFMKIDNKFYRFPYGNSSADDKICLGSLDKSTKKQPESIEEIAYVHLISTEANGDYSPHVKHDNTIVSTFDIEWLREKVERNDFTFSYMDALFYLSQCKSARDVNINIFLLSVQVPPEILKFEGAEDQASVREATPIEDEIEPEPTRNVRFGHEHAENPIENERIWTAGTRIVIPRAEFTSTTLVRQDGTMWLARIPIELLHQRYDPNNLDPRIQFVREIERADYEDENGNAIFLPTIGEEQVDTTYRATTGTTVYATWNTADATAVGDVVRREVVTGVQQEARDTYIRDAHMDVIESANLRHFETFLEQRINNEIENDIITDTHPILNQTTIEDLSHQAQQRLEQTLRDVHLDTAQGAALRQLGTIMAPIDQDPETIIIQPTDQVLETLLEPLNVQELTEPIATMEINFPPNEIENEENQQIIPHPRFWREPETIIIQPVQPLDRINLTVNITRDGVTFNEQSENNLTNIQETARQEISDVLTDLRTGRINNIGENDETIIQNEVENAENQ